MIRLKNNPARSQNRLTTGNGFYNCEASLVPDLYEIFWFVNKQVSLLIIKF